MLSLFFALSYPNKEDISAFQFTHFLFTTPLTKRATGTFCSTEYKIPDSMPLTIIIRDFFRDLSYNIAGIELGERMGKNIPEKVSNRLTLYHSIMVEYIEAGIDTISSPQIAQRLNIDDSQVRKDFKLLNNAGKCRVGYLVQELKDSIEKTLGFAHVKDAFIVGSGHLGLALAKYDNFNSYGLNILALFDNDPQKVDMQVNNKQIYHISKLPNLAQRLGVDIAILTVPRQYAQQVADFLISSNIKYIWNFTPAVLKVPRDVKVWNENIMGSFLQFACKDIIN